MASSAIKANVIEFITAAVALTSCIEAAVTQTAMSTAGQEVRSQCLPKIITYTWRALR